MAFDIEMIQEVYDRMKERVDEARKVVGKPLTLSETGATPMPHGKFVWNELATGDVDGAKRFFGEIAGWTFDSVPMEGGTYWVAKVEGEAMPVAGLFDKAILPHAVPTHWLAYLAVSDVDATVAANEAHGGKTVRPPFEVPNVGRIAVVMEPTGAAMGYMTPLSRG